VGLRTFNDALGVRWRVWRVETPAARAHLMDASFRNGWLVFEREDGLERRRLAQVPEDWASLPPRRLLQLCQVATPVVQSRSSATAGQPLTSRPGDVHRDR
jgi:hypothetical protein